MPPASRFAQRGARTQFGRAEQSEILSQRSDEEGKISRSKSPEQHCPKKLTGLTRLSELIRPLSKGRQCGDKGNYECGPDCLHNGWGSGPVCTSIRGGVGHAESDSGRPCFC